jgi:hypothetical protein
MNSGWLKLLDYFDRVLNLILERIAQNERDKLENDPAKWFDSHFDGLHDDTPKTNEADSADDKER